MTQPPALDALPPRLVAPLAGLTAAQLAAWSQTTGQQFVSVDLTVTAERKAALQAIGKAFGFPAHYGANLDALYDCLTDLAVEGSAGFVVLLQGLSHSRALKADDKTALLDVFRDATEVFMEADVALRVFHD